MNKLLPLLALCLLGCTPSPLPPHLDQKIEYHTYQEDTVTIFSTQDGVIFVGSGFIFGQTEKEYMVLTDKHVVGKQKDFILGAPTLYRDGIISKDKMKVMRVVGVSSDDLDLAVISIDKKDMLGTPKILSFYDGPPINVGEEIFSVGSPGNLEGLLSFGRVSKYTIVSDRLYILADNIGIQGCSGSGLIYKDKVIGIIQGAYSVKLNRSLSSKDIIKFLIEKKIEYSTR